MKSYNLFINSKLKKNIITEELIGTFKNKYGVYNVYKNPKSLSSFNPNIRGIIYKNGDLFICDDDGRFVGHDKLYQYIASNGLIDVFDKTGIDYKYNLCKEFISVIRYGNTEDLYLSQDIEVYNDKDKNYEFILECYNRCKWKNPGINYKPISIKAVRKEELNTIYQSINFRDFR